MGWMSTLIQQRHSQRQAKILADRMRNRILSNLYTEECLAQTLKLLITNGSWIDIKASKDGMMICVRPLLQNKGLSSLADELMSFQPPTDIRTEAYLEQLRSRTTQYKVSPQPISSQSASLNALRYFEKRNSGPLSSLPYMTNMSWTLPPKKLTLRRNYSIME